MEDTRKNSIDFDDVDPGHHIIVGIDALDHLFYVETDSTVRHLATGNNLTEGSYLTDFSYDFAIRCPYIGVFENVVDAQEYISKVLEER